MIEVRQTEIFARWLESNPGDVKSVGGGVSEMRIDYGPGYRVNFVRRGEALGGDKQTQSHDIVMAINLARDL